MTHCETKTKVCRKSARKHADTVASEQRASRPPWKEEANAVSLDSFRQKSSWLTVVSLVMAYQLYRNTTLGNSLQESLDELIQVIWATLAESFVTMPLLLRCLLAGSETSIWFLQFATPRSVPEECSTHFLYAQHLNHILVTPNTLFSIGVTIVYISSRESGGARWWLTAPCPQRSVSILESF